MTGATDHSTLPGHGAESSFRGAAQISVESPLQDDVRVLVAELNTALLELTPPEFCYHMTPEEMADPATTVFVARTDGRAVGIGALPRPAGGPGAHGRPHATHHHRHS